MTPNAEPAPEDASAPSAPEPFGARLRQAMDHRGPLCVGIDPHPELLGAWGLGDDPAGLARFTGTVVEALAGHVAVLKPQAAFYERFGSAGLAVLERALADARDAGALVVLDAKRGDIGSTMAAYAASCLGPGAPLRCDAVTLSPYLGYGALRPALDLARAHGAGAFVLARTSNPEGAAVQCARSTEGGTVAGDILRALAAENAGSGTLGSFGAVVGATAHAAHATDGPDGTPDANLAMGGPLLAPGLGAQGASPADLPARFGAVRQAVVPSVSRAVLRAGPAPRALRDVAARWAEETAAALG